MPSLLPPSGPQGPFNNRFYIEDSRLFGIFPETPTPYNNTAPVGSIKLNGATYCGGDLHIIPMQVFATDTPDILKVAILVADVCWDDGGCFAEINGCNIRTTEMTTDGQIRWDTGAIDCPKVYDILAEEG